MSVAIISGSSGLIGSEAVRHFHDKGMDVVGLDNNMRAYFFGPGASTLPITEKLKKKLKRFRAQESDIRDFEALNRTFSEFGKSISLVVHCAAQPSHDWAAREPLTDFGVNAVGTLNMLEVTRLHAPDAVFIFTSTNKVYGDTPNFLPLVEKESRYELEAPHPYSKYGINESMSLDQSKHSVFGASKVAGDIMAQEYGRYYGMKTGIFRGGCLTGPAHCGAELHGFLSFLIKCLVAGKHYTVFGYKGKQVRDNIHSADLVSAFDHFFSNPRSGEVYNMGGSRHSNCSILEAIAMLEKMSGKTLKYSISNEARQGDHIWWISDVSKFQKHYPEWEYKFDIKRILSEMLEAAELG